MNWAWLEGIPYSTNRECVYTSEDKKKSGRGDVSGVGHGREDGKMESCECLIIFQLLTTNRSWFFDDMFENEIESLVEDHTHSKYNLHIYYHKTFIPNHSITFQI